MAALAVVGFGEKGEIGTMFVGGCSILDGDDAEQGGGGVVGVSQVGDGCDD